MSLDPSRNHQATPRRSSLDAIVLNLVLQGCRDPRVALQNAQELLVPGGTLFVEVPNNACYSARRFGPAWSLCNAGRHLNFFTEGSLCRLVKSTGYDVRDILYRQYIPQFTCSRLISEQLIWDRLFAGRSQPNHGLHPRKSTIDLWTGLAQTMFQQPSAKYEIVGIIAAKRYGRIVT